MQFSTGGVLFSGGSFPFQVITSSRAKDADEKGNLLGIAVPFRPD